MLFKPNDQANIILWKLNDKKYPGVYELCCQFNLFIIMVNIIKSN